MKYITTVLAALSLQLFTGCFQSAIGIHIKPDGSGTLDQVFSMSNTMVTQMKQGLKDAPSTGPAPKLPTEIDEPRLKAAAAKLGDGVTFVSAKKLALPGREGYLATYAFKDVTKLKITSHPDMGDQTGGQVATAKKEEPITFQFTKGKTAELVINSPVTKTEPTAPVARTAQDDEMNEAMMPMMEELCKDMRMSFVVDVQGTIVKTNASHRQGNRLTITDIEYSKLLADKAKFKAMEKLKDPNSAEAKALLKTIPGVTVETSNPIRISFQ